MRANRKEPESAPFWCQSLAFYCRPHGGLLLVTSGLQGEQASVMAVELNQLVVVAAFNDSAIFDDDDLAGHAHGREAV